jgi:hypothetical protein
MIPEDKTQIRIRAWDAINNEMHYNFQYMYIVSGNENEIPSGIIFSSDIRKHDFSKWPPSEDIDRKMIIMEWVRAIDDMGMPIYEYDIVNVVESGGKEWLGMASWGTRGSALCWDLTNLKNDKLYDYCFFDKEGTKFTRIGNIYENRKLVKHLYENGILID